MKLSHLIAVTVTALYFLLPFNVSAHEARLSGGAGENGEDISMSTEQLDHENRDSDHAPSHGRLKDAAAALTVADFVLTERIEYQPLLRLPQMALPAGSFMDVLVLPPRRTFD